VSPEATAEAPLPALAKAFAEAQAAYDKEKKDIQRMALDKYAEYEQVRELEKKGAKIPANLQDMHDKLEAWKKREQELKHQIVEAKAAADAERRIVQLSMGSNVEGLDAVAADMSSKDVELLLTVAGQPESWLMHLKKYTPKESSGQRVISRWAIAGLEPKK
jgi:chromosome segregation ATPase